MANAPSLYACLVGINSYPQSPLHGCINDVRKVESYLSLIHRHARVHTLLDHQATKPAIVDAFENVLAGASEHDTVLFYFSGHGALERAAEIWAEPGSQLKCLVCYHQHGDAPPSFLLADKELRYLICKLAAHTSHVVIVTDCCHSGGNTRNAPFIEKWFAKDEPLQRRYATVFAQRAWSDFIFGAALQPPAPGTPVAKFLPQGVHIGIAACDADETSIEINGEGVFTKALMQALKTEPGSSYAALMRRIRQYLRGVYRQQPQLHVFDPENVLAAKSFLDHPPTAKAVAAMVHNRTLGWSINLGAINGVVRGQSFVVVDPEARHIQFVAAVGDVHFDYSLATTEADLAIAKSYEALIERHDAQRIKLYINAGDGDPKPLQWLLDVLTVQLAGIVALVDDGADYWLNIQHGKIYLSNTGDQYRPLTYPIAIADGRHAEAAVADTLRHLARFEFVKSLKGDSTRTDPLQVTVAQVEHGIEKPVPIREGNATIRYYRDGNGVWTQHLKIDITNTRPVKMFVSALYMRREFDTLLDVLPGPVITLGPHESITLRVGNESTIPLQVDPVVRDYNWPDVTEYIRFFVNTEAFEPFDLLLRELPSPPTLEGERGVIRFDPTDPKNHQWTVQTLRMTFVNPWFNRVDNSRLKAMLTRADMAFFAAGLYLENAGDLPSGDITLKKDMAVAAAPHIAAGP